MTDKEDELKTCVIDFNVSSHDKMTKAHYRLLIISNGIQFVGMTLLLENVHTFKSMMLATVHQNLLLLKLLSSFLHWNLFLCPLIPTATVTAFGA